MTGDGGSDELRIDWFTRLTPESAMFLPWMCIGAAMHEIGEGVLTVGPEDFQAAGGPAAPGSHPVKAVREHGNRLMI